MKRRGFTLAEVLVGLLIISFAFSILASSYLSSVRNIRKGRGIHEAAFDLRAAMEDEMANEYSKLHDYINFWDNTTNQWKTDTPEEVKNRWTSVDVRPMKDIYTCCGFKISGYPVEATSHGTTLYSFVAAKDRNIKLPVIGKANLTSAKKFYYLEEGSISLTGSYRDVANEDELFDVQKRWYASNQGVFKSEGLGDFCLGKGYIAEDQSPAPDRRPFFSSDYTRLPERTDVLNINPSEEIYRDVAIYYSVTPLGRNKYVGKEIRSDEKVYIIGLPMMGASLYGHYSADLVTNAIMQDLSSLGTVWSDVRSYIDQPGFTGANPLEFQGCTLEKSDWGDYVSFNKDAKGVIKESDLTIFFRVRDLDHSTGKRISLIQSPKADPIAANVGKEQFDLAFDNGRLVWQTKTVIQNPDGTIAYGPMSETVLISDTETDSSYSSFSGDINEQRSGFNVISVKIVGGNIEKIEKHVLEKGGESYSVAEPISLGGGISTSNLMIGAFTISASNDLNDNENEGSMGISDVAAYQGTVSDDFVKRVGEYLLLRYMPEL